MTSIKLCKDCKHFKLDERYIRLSTCLVSALRKTNLVTGIDEGGYCENEREHGNCGVAGNLFEPANHQGVKVPAIDTAQAGAK